MLTPKRPDIVMISARAITTLGVPLPSVIRKSGMRRPFACVRVSSQAIAQEIAMPAVAAADAATKLFLAVSRMPLRVKRMCQ